MLFQPAGRSRPVYMSSWQSGHTREATVAQLIHARMLKKKHPEWWADDEDKSDDTENPLAKGKTKDEKEME